MKARQIKSVTVGITKGDMSNSRVFLPNWIGTCIAMKGTHGDIRTYTKAPIWQTQHQIQISIYCLSGPILKSPKFVHLIRSSESDGSNFGKSGGAFWNWVVSSSDFAWNEHHFKGPELSSANVRPTRFRSRGDGDKTGKMLNFSGGICSQCCTFKWE